MPVPWDFVVKNASKILSVRSGGNPIPVSRIEISRWSSEFRSDREVPYHICLIDGIDSVAHQVYKDLLQLHAVRHYMGQLRREIGVNRNRMLSSLAAHQADDFPNHFIHIDPFSLLFSLLKQNANSSDDVRSSGYILNDSRYG
jgi:hypothetical protein